MKELKCPNCGSNNIEILKEKSICKHCGTTFVESKIEITNITNITNSNAIREKHYEINNNFSEDIFYKKAMVFLAVNKNVGENIYNAKFEKPKLSYHYASLVECDCKISYSMLIGSYKKSIKKVEESYYDTRTLSLKKHLVNREFEDLVWEPYSGKYDTTLSEISFFDESLSAGLKIQFEKYINKISSADMNFAKRNEKFPKISVAEIDRVTTNCVNLAASDYKNFIDVDKYSNFKIRNGRGDINNITTYKIPLYSLSFSLDGKSYILYCLANDYTFMFIDEIKNPEKEKLIEVNKTKQDKIIAPIFWILCSSLIVFSIMTIFFMATAKNLTPMIVLFIWFMINIAGLISLKITSSSLENKIEKKIKSYETKVYLEKKEKCKAFCQKENISEPTNEEFLEFLMEADDED